MLQVKIVQQVAYLLRPNLATFLDKKLSYYWKSLSTEHVLSFPADRVQSRMSLCEVGCGGGGADSAVGGQCTVYSAQCVMDSE